METTIRYIDYFPITRLPLIATELVLLLMLSHHPLGSLMAGSDLQPPCMWYMVPELSKSIVTHSIVATRVQLERDPAQHFKSVFLRVSLHEWGSFPIVLTAATVADSGTGTASSPQSINVPIKVASAGFREPKFQMAGFGVPSLWIEASGGLPY